MIDLWKITYQTLGVNRSFVGDNTSVINDILTIMYYKEHIYQHV